MGDEKERDEVPATADKPTPVKAESPDQTSTRRLQIAHHVAKIVNVRPSRVEVRFLYAKLQLNQSMYRVHIKGDNRRILSSHFIRVQNPVTNSRGWPAIRAVMAAVPVEIVDVAPPFPLY